MPSRTSGGTPGGDNLQHVFLPLAYLKNNPSRSSCKLSAPVASYVQLQTDGHYLQ
jgi:hypothetical protein